MTEVASLLQNGISRTKHFGSQSPRPPGTELVDADTFATTKEEEWISKKKTEVTNTKQIETRVKRQVVLEDGKVVEDTGPMVTTNTTEDTETQEHHQTEHRKLGDDLDGSKALEGGERGTLINRSEWVPVPNPDGVVREVKERRVVSREEIEEVKETEDVQHLGDISEEAFLAAVNSGKSDLRSVLRSTEGGKTLVSTGPRLVRDTTKSKKVTDTEDTRELSSVLPDGKIVTETQRTTEHEEVRDDELPEDAPEQNFRKESSQRYVKTREQEDVDYLSGGKNIGHEMRYKTETMEVEKRGDGVDEPDLFESLSARARRRGNNRQPHRYRGVQNGVTSPLDRKDAITGHPLNFDQEEETRKVETSKWLEHHFGSDSRSSNSTLDDIDDHLPKSSVFNITVNRSQPSRPEGAQKNFISPVNSSSPRVYSPVELDKDRNHPSGYYKGISEWSERRQEHRYTTRTDSPYHQSASPSSQTPYQPSPPPHYNEYSRRSPVPDYRRQRSPTPNDIPRRSPIPDYRPTHSPIDRKLRSPIPDYRQRSPVPDYRQGHSPSPDYGRSRISPMRDMNPSPTPPQRKKTSEKQRQRVVEERTRYDSGYRSGRLEDSRDDRVERVEEPPPDYSPPSPPPMPTNDKKHFQKTRFATEQAPQKQKSGNIIGQSIRKLVNKIRSASTERKSKQRVKRSPSPSYQPGHVIDANIGTAMERQPVQRYYLGEDPFAGSIYGRENKYDGVKPARSSRRPKEEDRRSHSTLGRLSKSTGRLINHRGTEVDRSSQTLPRHPNKYDVNGRLDKNVKSSSTLNVSTGNSIHSSRFANEGPAKPARTYKSNLARSKSLIVHGEEPFRNNMYTSNPHIHRLDENPIGLKSPGLISSLSRSQKDLNGDVYIPRFHRNGVDTVDNARKTGFERNEKRVYISNVKDRAPDMFKTVVENGDDWKPKNFSTPVGKSARNFNGSDVYEPPTRLRESNIVSTAPNSILRRGSTSSTDFSETYRTTTRNDDPVRPSVTNTVKTVSKKTIPSKDGRSVETIESSETKSITKSHYRGNRTDPSVKYYETERRFRDGGTSNSKPIVIEVKNYRK
ncbi:serine/arginine repetitive matrix protein 1 isoform X2 [Cylas formicarius]|uniref:serine/arginine repetitive matrix protein 1 isoform X2 n=1 Tax=Cylas formicarius TaxID=197179 RepID=UPI002958B039|nr:serine/arginine repetitive matrix protein 1 isoform X2 [Cylas formicarius]